MFGACSKANKQETDLQTMNIKGKVTTLKEIYYSATDNFGTVVKSQSETQTYWTFTDAGYVKEYYSLRGGDLIEKAVYSYDQRNNIESCRMAINVNVTQEFIQTYQYNKKGEKISSVLAKPGGDIEEKVTYVWDKKGNLSAEVYYETDGSMSSKEEYSYDGSGRVTEHLFKDGMGNITRKMAYQYAGSEKNPQLLINYQQTGVENNKVFYTWGSNGEVLEEKTVASDLTETVTTYKYTWDKNNNWTERTEYNNGAPVEVIERVYNEALPAIPEMMIEEAMDSPAVMPSVTASSTNPKYPVANLMDGNPKTTWVAGPQGTGAGEFLTFTFNPATSLKTMNINPGFAMDDNVWTGNNRLKEISLEFSDSSRKTVTFDGNRRFYSVELGKKNVSWVKLHIVSTFAGSKWADTCISEISFE